MNLCAVHTPASMAADLALRRMALTLRPPPSGPVTSGRAPGSSPSRNHRVLAIHACEQRTLDPSLIARGIGVMRELIVASPEFLAQHAPQGISEPEQLSTLEAIRHRSFRDDGQWTLQRGEESATVPMRGSLAINHFIGMRRAALRGIGIARLPRYLVFDELLGGRLVELLPDWQLPATPVSLVYPSREHLPQRSRVFRDFIVEWFDKPEHAELLR